MSAAEALRQSSTQREKLAAQREQVRTEKIAAFLRDMAVSTDRAVRAAIAEGECSAQVPFSASKHFGPGIDAAQYDALQAAHDAGYTVRMVDNRIPSEQWWGMELSWAKPGP